MSEFKIEFKYGQPRADGQVSIQYVGDFSDRSNRLQDLEDVLKGVLATLRHIGFSWDEIISTFLEVQVDVRGLIAEGEDIEDDEDDEDEEEGSEHQSSGYKRLRRLMRDMAQGMLMEPGVKPTRKAADDKIEQITSDINQVKQFQTKIAMNTELAKQVMKVFLISLLNDGS